MLADDIEEYVRLEGGCQRPPTRRVVPVKSAIERSSTDNSIPKVAARSVRARRGLASARTTSPTRAESRLARWVATATDVTSALEMRLRAQSASEKRAPGDNSPASSR